MRTRIATLCFAFVLTLSTAAFAHTPLFNCLDNGDGNISCEGGFSDGSSASNVPVRLLDEAGKVIQETKLDKNSEVIFKKPTTPYSVQFDAGEGHKLTVSGKDIAK